MQFRALIASLFCAMLFAVNACDCGGPQPEEDAGASRDASSDAGQDAGSDPDAATVPDAVQDDGAGPDSATPDTGTDDTAGGADDAGNVDDAGGAEDARSLDDAASDEDASAPEDGGAAVDAWLSEDAAPADAAAREDAGPEDAAPQPLANAAALSGHFDHTCALLSGGRVRCWGFSQVGRPDIQRSAYAVDALQQGADGPEPLTGVDEVEVGTGACVRRAGSALCWGPIDGSRVATEILESQGGDALSGVTMVSEGLWSACAVMQDTSLRCWGHNEHGQLGIGVSDTMSHYPETVCADLNNEPCDPLTGVQRVAVGRYYTCAVVTGGAVKCWGKNDRGQLGDGTWDMSPLPRDVSGMSSGAIEIAANFEHSCAIHGQSREIKCWGNNGHYQLGDGQGGSQQFSNVSVDVVTSDQGPLLAGAMKLSLGQGYSCALLDGGEVRCWGRNEYGYLGNGDQVTQHYPVPMTQAPGPVADIACSSYTNCILLQAGGVQCVGLALGGELGDGDPTEHTSLEFVDVVCAPGRTCD